MIPAAFPRSIAITLLRFAIWIAPHDTHDWGHGMLSELNHVEGNWSALLWSLGGAGVLAKHAVLSLIFLSRNRPIIPAAGDLFAKERPMRKTTLSAIAACVVASPLFFLAPVFRQAFRVSLAQWHDVLHVQLRFTYAEPDPELDAVAKKAEQSHDAEGLAFVAVRTSNPSESARLADEAVQLDPKLTWIYGVVAVDSPTLPEIGHWVPELEKFDPQNALPHFIVAEKIDIDQVIREKIPHRVNEQPAAWQNAMAAAFQSPKLDNYLGLFKDLDRRVLLRYQVNDPFQVFGDEVWYGLPSYAAADSSSYAESLLESGQILEDRKDRKGAFEKYLTVARFGQTMGPAGIFLLRQELQVAYKRLGRISEEEGNKVEAAFYTSLTAETDRARQEELISLRKGVQGSYVSHWNAFLVKISGLVILFSAGLLLTCLLAVIVRGKSLRLSALRPSRPTLVVGLCGGVGALLASAVLYVSYRPYAEIVQRFIRNGDQTSLTELSSFLGSTQVPLGAQGFLHAWEFVFYFWFGVTLLCVLALLIAILRHFQTRPRAAAA
jgi:hypothetical protein